MLSRLLAGQGNPQLVAALQAGLAQMVGQSSGYIESLPEPIQKRIAYLNEIDEKVELLSEQYEEEVRELAKKYEQLKLPLFDDRKAVITGDIEVPDNQGVQEEDVPKGVPDFWRTVLTVHPHLAEIISEKDEDVLSYLTDIREETLDPEMNEEELLNGGGFRLTFSFTKENPYFSNPTLTKEYLMDPEDSDTLFEIKGCDIQWKQGKNVTIKVLKKKPKAGAKNTKPQTKTETVDSFFRWFTDVPTVPDTEEEADEDDEEMQQLQEKTENDMEIAEVVREMIERPVAFFTGEALMENEEDFEDEEGDDEEDEEDEQGEGDEEDEEEEEGGQAAADQECKQQ